MQLRSPNFRGIASTDPSDVIYRKYPRYKGILKQPLPPAMLLSPLLDSAQVPAWYPFSEQSWVRKVDKIRRREGREWERRVQALGKFYGIAIDREPDGSDCWHRLAVALVIAHVPAFDWGHLNQDEFAWRAKAAGKRPVRLSRTSTYFFALLVYQALGQGLSTSHKIAKFVTDPKLLRVERPKTDRWGAGWRSRDLRPLSFETAKYLVPQLRAAWKDVCRGTANTFQHQVIAAAVKDQGTRWPRTRPGAVWKAVFSL